VIKKMSIVGLITFSRDRNLGACGDGVCVGVRVCAYVRVRSCRRVCLGGGGKNAFRRYPM